MYLNWLLIRGFCHGIFAGMLILGSAVTDSEVGLWTKSSLQTGMVVVNQEFLLIIM